MPHLPVMDISPVRIIWIVKRAPGGRAGRPVEGFRVFFSQDLRKDPLIHEQIIPDFGMFGNPASFVHKHFHLIISAPQSQAGVMADPPDIFLQLSADIFFKLWSQLIDRAGKHKILPYRQPQLITKIIEPVVGIKAAAPYPDHVKICSFTVFQKLPGFFSASFSQQVFLRYIIGSHGKKRNPVNLMGKAFPPLIFFPSHRHFPKTDPLLPAVFRFSVPIKHRPDLI